MQGRCSKSIVLSVYSLRITLIISSVLGYIDAIGTSCHDLCCCQSVVDSIVVSIVMSIYRLCQALQQTHYGICLHDRISPAQAGACVLVGFGATVNACFSLCLVHTCISPPHHTPFLSDTSRLTSPLAFPHRNNHLPSFLGVAVPF